MDFEDSFRYKGLRQRLVNEIRKKGITDERVLEAIGKVPRHLFMDKSFVNLAYKDQAFPIGEGQTISQPYTVAVQSSLLKVRPGEKVLEIGTGSGYQAAVLSEMGARVFSVERQSLLYQKTSRLLKSIGYRNIRLFLGDGYEGLPNFAPFDKIIVTAAVKNVPAALLLQLKTEGLLVVPLGEGSQTMTRIKRLTEDNFEQETFGEFAFVPMLKGIAK
ncbi:protein-L-isoaspartate(D-aspartate) O-methyltransferase [Thermophagus xiamenensis]|uniref:Protein-L-isoaspartate O-methyltransferase n=1 Tax=Thermophagus xiamenensis TaxID=385682 RepID=A0A1I2ABT1_9BACT|nr:protein-L-isoaspartate(D-aspartate) O-methyltransferase [Thermophagus xiamenensis]SFE41018.1 protein-L-isoaspartate(D-aspartate) O-methyltransferase [Thermophagus xiamenensis]